MINNNNIGNVTVRQRKETGKFEYRFEIEPLDGKRRWKSQGGFPNKTQARRAGEAAKQEYLQSRFNPVINSYNMSFSKLTELYLERVLNSKEPTTYNMYKTYCDKYFVPEFGRMPVKEITYRDVEKLLTKLARLNYSDSWLSNSRVILKEIFKFASVPLHIIKMEENPVELADVKLEGNNSEERVPYTKDEIKLIFETIPKDSIYRPVIILGIFCGLRIGEILGLTFDNIDFENNRIIILQQMANARFDHCSYQIIKSPKSKKSVRTIYVSEWVINELKVVRDRQLTEKEELGDLYLYPQIDNRAWT